MAEAPRLFLITPPIADAPTFAPRLQAALDGAEVASLLLRSASADPHSIKAIVKTLAPMAQAKGVAVLIAADARLAARLDVDGVHVDGRGPAYEAEFKAALDTLKPHKIVGVGGLASRDAAMTAGERGADYLMFGGPGSGESHESIRHRVAWWAEIFNVPCVGYASRPDLAADVMAAGAEFVALCEGFWDTSTGIDAAIAALRGSFARETAA